MKKFYFFCLAMLLGVCFSAKAQESEDTQAYTITFQTENPDLVVVYGDYWENPEAVLECGKAYEYTEFQGFYLKPATDYVFAEITGESDLEGADLSRVIYLNASSAYIYYTPSEQHNLVVNIKVANLEDLRTASVLVNVDNASKVELKMENGIVELKDGSNEIWFAPELESNFNFCNPDGLEFYSFKVNGEDVEKSSWSTDYYVDLKDGDVVDILADFPEGSGLITINFADDFTKEKALLGITVNNEPYEYDGPFELPYGDKLSLQFNSGECTITEFTVNGEDCMQDYMYYYTISKVLGDYEIYIAAEGFPDVTFTVDVDHPEYVSAYYYNGEQVDIPLVEGENEVTISSGLGQFYLRPANALCEIKSVTVDGVEQEVWGSYGVTLELSSFGEHSIVKVESGVLEFETEAVVYISEGEYESVSLMAEDYAFSFYLVGYGKEQFGYTPIGWDGEHKIVLGAYPPYQSGLPVYAYLNNEALESTYDEGMYVTGLEIADGDVLKIYQYEPAISQVSVVDEIGALQEVVSDMIVLQFDAEEGIENNNVEFEALSETQIQITVDPSKDYDLEVNGVLYDLNEEGEYFFTIGDENLEIAVLAHDGISSLAADKMQNNVVYNMQGIAVMKNASAADVQTLRRGIYMLNGQKIVVR